MAWRRTRAIQVWTNVIVLALSFSALGSVRACPPSARSGRPLSSAQRHACGVVEGLVTAWVRGPLLPANRGLMKMQALHAFAEQIADTAVGCRCAPPAALQVRPFVSQRARFLDEPLHFDCTRYLADVFEAAAFVEPRLLLLDHPRPCEARKARFVRSEPLLDYAKG